MLEKVFLYKNRKDISTALVFSKKYQKSYSNIGKGC